MGKPRPSFVAGFLALGTAAFYLTFWCTQLFTVGINISAESEEFHRYVVLAILPVICLCTGFGYLGGLGRSRAFGPVLLALALLGVAGALFIDDWVSALFLAAALCFGWQDFSHASKENTISSRNTGDVKGEAWAPHFCQALNALWPGWVVEGDSVTGPAGANVRFAQTHGSSSTGHVDVEFRFDASTSFWDCVSGIGETQADKARAAAHVWASTTGGAMIELKYSQKGAFADHFFGTDPDGFPHWHSICGRIMGVGDEDAASRLQQWWLAHPLLPGLARAIGQDLAHSQGPHGIKLIFGADGVAEVRIDGTPHDAGSDWLAGLDWPRGAAFVRSYVVLAHPD